MSVTLSRRLSNSFEGALAGGGDPATSPLYVFGPFLKLIVVAGVANVTFGASIWLAILSVVVVSAMYRKVMFWITDGSGGSGLSEEEFGSWAVKITAGITVVEYLLTYLVSMAALVTFLADRFTFLNSMIQGVSYRSELAIALTGFCCWVVNLGPKVSARAFGPATGAVLLLLWGMVFATIYVTGFHLPDFNLQAFSLDEVRFISTEGVEESSSYLSLTFGGYARILALMTGIEIFANLVAAYDGTRAERSRKAFGSLIIIMGTTAVTMLIVGPAILAHSDPLNEHVSVFTQTMDFLFPPWLSYTGTLIGVAVLLSACAAAAQAIQNLALGLRYRHYIMPKLGQRNKHDVTDLPVWIMAAVSSLCFLFFGTHEETYLALYAAGVFILLSMTGWAASKRLLRELRLEYTMRKLAALSGTLLSSLLTTFATVVIFEERFYEGAWSYFLLIPLFYAVFSHYRNRLGAPPSVEDRLGRIISGQGFAAQAAPDEEVSEGGTFKKMLIAANSSTLSEKLAGMVHFLGVPGDTQVELLISDDTRPRAEQLDYARSMADFFTGEALPAEFKIVQDDDPYIISQRAVTTQSDLILIPVNSTSSLAKLQANSDMIQVIKQTMIPTLILKTASKAAFVPASFARIVVALDGSEAAESVLVYLRTLARAPGAMVYLLSVPEGSESEDYVANIQIYLDKIAADLRKDGIDAIVTVTGSGPARTILAMAESLNADLIVMASHGRAGTERPTIHIGSVTEKVLQKTPCSLFVVPLTKCGRD